VCYARKDTDRAGNDNIQSRHALGSISPEPLTFCQSYAVRSDAQLAERGCDQLHVKYMKDGSACSDCDRR
jgi:hypothetical protein